MNSLVQAKLISPSLELLHPLLVDSGADEIFMDWRLAKQLGVRLFPLTKPLEASSLDGRLLCKVTHHTQPIQLMMAKGHREFLSFLLYSCPSHPLLLGLPWLSKHNPHIDWSSGEILGCGKDCSPVCFPSEPVSAPPPSSRLVSPDTDFLDISNVPACYLDLKEVFNKNQATFLPPHRSYDCCTDLLPGSSPLRGRLYSLSAPERETVQTYIQSSPEAGIIRPSSSPAGAGFFIVDKKYKTLRPCIDYSGLNTITIWNRYPLPLISSVFELLQDAKCFTKLDLRSAYHLVRIREGVEWKTAFNTPSGHYEYLVMPFGLTNAPAVFQALVNDVLRDMLDKFVFVHLDDILIFCGDEQTHMRHVHQVLQRLLHNQLFVKAEKCEFHFSTVSLLGFVVSSNSIQIQLRSVWWRSGPLPPV